MPNVDLIYVRTTHILTIKPLQSKVSHEKCLKTLFYVNYIPNVVHERKEWKFADLMQ